MEVRFHRNRTRASGYDSICVKCTAIRDKKRYEERKDEILARAKKTYPVWYEKNRESVIARVTRTRKEKKEEENAENE